MNDISDYGSEHQSAHREITIEAHFEGQPHSTPVM